MRIPAFPILHLEGDLKLLCKVPFSFVQKIRKRK